MAEPKHPRYVVRPTALKGATAAAGMLVAAATLAAVAAFAPVAAPPVSADARIQGVQQDLARAVALRQVTEEQAKLFEEQLKRRIQTSQL